MKKLSSLLILLVGFFSLLQGQNSITIQGESINDAYINSVNFWPDGHQQSLIAAEWTYYGNEGVGRSLIRFDLSEIPVYSKITFAKLSLYHDPNSGHIGHSNMGGDNTGIIMRVAEDWEDEVVTWQTQPITTNTNWRLIHPPESEDQDYPNIDVTQLVQDMVNHADVQQGFMIKLLEENALYRSLVFASVDHPDPDLRPQLYVEYDEQEEPGVVINLKPGPGKGKDAYINRVNNSPDGNESSLVASVWTHNGEPGTGRFLIDFQLPQLPGDKEIVKAELNLYHNPTSGHQGHSKMGGSNELVIQRITEYWEEQTVYWYNQPETTAENETYVNASNLENQHYLNIDVTNLVNDIISNPDEGYGFLLKLIDETSIYRSVVFASSDHDDSQLWPGLDIYYGDIITQEGSDPGQMDCKIYPNPNTGQFRIELNSNVEEPVETFIYDQYGKLILKTTTSNQISEIDMGNPPSGIYFVQINCDNRMLVKKVSVSR